MVQELAFAKINLTLDILGKRSDGYHSLQTIMQSLDLADVVELEKSDAIELKISGNDSLPTDENNLAFRAVLAVNKACGKNLGVIINLSKKIPAAAGLAGGSSDAAAVIRGLNRLYNLNLTAEKMCEIGAQLGSDIPFCIIGGTCLAEGRGEKLTPLPALKNFSVVLIKPRGEISTAWAYKTYDENSTANHISTFEIIEMLRAGDYGSAFKNFANVLEAVAVKKIPAIETYKNFLLENGAEFALMSGSGPTVFTLTDELTAKKIAANFEGNAQIFITKTRND